MAKQEISVQVNMVPFAHGKPGYPERQKYLQALQAELASAAEYADDYEVGALCITGASPLQYPADALAKMIETLQENIAFQNDAEITVNALPGSVTYADLRLLRDQGVNRVRFDMRSFVPSELEAIGRTYSHRAMEVFMRMVQLKFVFFNYEVVLYYGLPGQTPESLRHSIDEAIKYMGMNITLLPCGEGDAPRNLDFYQEAARFIGLYDYQQYTPYHFARPRYASRWNRLAHSNQPRLGFGANTVSRIDGMMSQTTADVEKYISAGGDAAGLIVRLEPVSQSRFDSTALLERLYNLETGDFTALNPALQEAVRRLCERGLLRVENGERVALTAAGKAGWQAVSSELLCS